MQLLQSTLYTYVCIIILLAVYLYVRAHDYHHWALVVLGHVSYLKLMSNYLLLIFSPV